jgi:uncharacterized protein (TIGR00251 family)
MPGWYRLDADRNILCINVRVQPNARSTEVSGRHGEALKIRVAAPPVDARANRLLLEFIAKTLGVAMGRVRIVRGANSRRKAIEVDGPGEAALRMLREWDR